MPDGSSRFKVRWYPSCLARVIISSSSGVPTSLTSCELSLAGRLIADPNHDSFEYAILVADKYQDKGLGGILTDYCMEIAQQWGVKRIFAITTTDNPRMISVFRKRGFEIKPDPDGSTVDASKNL